MTDELAKSIARVGADSEVEALLNRVCELTGMGFAAVAYVSETRWIACQVEDRIAFGLKPGDELEIKKTICDDIRQSGRSIAIDDTGADPDWWNHPVPILYGFRSYVSLPIVIDGEFFGTLCAIDDAPREKSLQAIERELEAMAQEMADLIGRRLPLEPSIT
jgi:GAF domain-containing protein